MGAYGAPGGGWPGGETVRRRSRGERVALVSAVLPLSFSLLQGWKMQKIKRKRRGKGTLRSNEKRKTLKISRKLGPGFGNNLSKIGENSSSEISKQVASEVSGSVVSIASFDGDKLLYECTGVFIEGSCADAKSILTVASAVGYPDFEVEDALTIKVRLPNEQVVTGWLHSSDVDHDLAVVNIKSACGFQTIDLSSNHHVQFDSNHKVVAAGRCFDSGILKSSNGIVLSSPNNDHFGRMFSTCKIDKVLVGGPLVDYEGNFVGMNCLRRCEKTAFLPKNKILERLGALRDNAADSVDVGFFTRDNAADRVDVGFFTRDNGADNVDDGYFISCPKSDLPKEMLRFFEEDRLSKMYRRLE